MSSRERERDACDVIDITLKSRVIMHTREMQGIVGQASDFAEVVSKID